MARPKSPNPLQTRTYRADPLVTDALEEFAKKDNLSVGKIIRDNLEKSLAAYRQAAEEKQNDLFRKTG